MRIVDYLYKYYIVPNKEITEENFENERKKILELMKKIKKELGIDIVFSENGDFESEDLLNRLELSFDYYGYTIIKDEDEFEMEGGKEYEHNIFLKKIEKLIGNEYNIYTDDWLNDKYYGNSLSIDKQKEILNNYGYKDNKQIEVFINGEMGFIQYEDAKNKKLENENYLFGKGKK